MEQPTRSQRLKEQKQHDFQEHLEKNINSRAHHAKDSSSEEHKQLAQHHEEVHLTDPHPVQVSAHTSLDEGLTRAQRAHRSQRRRSRLHAGHAASESHEAEEDVSGESGSESGEDKIEKKPATDNIKAKEEKSVDKKEEKKEEEKKDEEKSKDNEEEKKEEASIKPEEASAVRGYLKETVGSLAEKLGNLTGIGFLKETGKELFESGKTELELAKGEDSKPTAEEVKEEVSDKAQEVKETMTDKAKEVKEMMTDKAQEAKEVISDKAAQMGKSLGVESEGLKEKGAREKAQ